MEQSNIIDLKPIIEKQEKFTHAVLEAQIAVETAKTTLAAYSAQAAEDILKALHGGATTGVPLQDEILTCFGLDVEALVKLKAVNDAWSLLRGKDVLLEFTSQRRVRFGNTYDPRRDCVPVSDYILGTVQDTGNARIQLRDEENLAFTSTQIILPFEKYMSWNEGMLAQQNLVLKEGACTLVDNFTEPCTNSLLCHFLERPSDTTVKITSGDKIDARFPHLKKALDLLHGQADEEETLNPS